LVGSLGLLLVFGAIFSEEIKELLSENRKLQKSMETHKSFVQVGQNVTGLVHNFKGVTQGLENYSYLMEKASSRLGEEQLVGYSRKIREGVKTLSRRIDNILLATRALNDTELRVVEVNRLLESIVELFNTIREFKHNVTVRFEFPGEVRLRCNVNECSQIFENIIRNSWEAILERRKSDNRHYGELSVGASELEGSVTVLFRDNGIGMEACRRCRNGGEGCLDCERWRVGNTTKEGGAGFGMVYVVDKVRKYGGNLKVRSEPLKGTEVEVSLRSL
jgi:two-component system nitrogen regulation sensor histidine kinase GlnL